MKKHESARKLEQLWEKGFEYASQAQPHDDSLDRAALDMAAGLSIESGAKAGYWSQDFTCGCPNQAPFYRG